MKDCSIVVDEGYRLLYFVTCRVCSKNFATFSAWEKHIDIKFKRKKKISQHNSKSVVGEKDA
ncbi:MAG TPA: hypothetical protein VIH04_07885 [Nitrosarchaeum sp.]